VTQERELAVDGSDKDDKIAPRLCDFLTNSNGQDVLGSRGVFWPTSNALFQGRWFLLTGRAIMGIPPATPRSALSSLALATEFPNDA
jgi:hypothetical protein